MTEAEGRTEVRSALIENNLYHDLGGDYGGYQQQQHDYNYDRGRGRGRGSRGGGGRGYGYSGGRGFDDFKEPLPGMHIGTKSIMQWENFINFEGIFNFVHKLIMY